MSSPITLAVAGGTGVIGSHVVKAALRSDVYPSQISRVIVYTTDANSDKAKAVAKLGAEVVEVKGEYKAEHLKGVDVVVSTLVVKVPKPIFDSVYQAAAEAGVKVYIPSEFGLNHPTPGVSNPVLAAKEANSAAARQAGLKVVELHVGLFLEDSINPALGFDTKNRRYTALGPITNRFTVTSKSDIGSATVRAGLLALNNPASVPDVVIISGDAKSYQEIAEIVGRERGEEIQIVEESPEQNKPGSDPAAQFAFFLRKVNSSGTTDYSKNNSNELVNPGQKYWKWKGIAEFAKEINVD